MNLQLTVRRLLPAIDGPPVQQEQIGINMPFSVLERLAYHDEQTQGTVAVVSHSEGRESEPPPRQGSQRDLDHYVTVLLAGVCAFS